MASASVMACNNAGYVEGTHCNTLLALQQLIMLRELAVNRILGNAPYIRKLYAV
ncbi:DUF6124 family protein [Pseudomonas sp. LB3P14]